MPVPLPERGDRLCVIGILNVTPDSFSDGGRYAGVDEAIAHGVHMHRLGADLVDVGGESTRPGAQRIEAAEELRRITPVVEGLIAAGVPLSIDTTRAAVAEATLDLGAAVVNDVSGGLADPDMVRVVRDNGCPWIVMHWRGQSDHMRDLAVYDDVVKDVRTELLARVDAALAAGVQTAQLVLDPGLGFAKVGKHDLALLAAVPTFVELGLPVLIGASRKSFLGRLLRDDEGRPREPAGRDNATAAITAYCATAGVWGVRVHDVQSSVDAALTMAAIEAAR